MPTHNLIVLDPENVTPSELDTHVCQASKEAARAEGRDALEGMAHRRRHQKRLDRRLEEVAKAVGGGYCRLQMPLTLALGVRGQWLGISWGPWRGGTSPRSNASLAEGRGRVGLKGGWVGGSKEWVGVEVLFSGYS